MNWQFLKINVGEIQKKLKKTFQSRFPKKETFLITFQILLIAHSTKQKMKSTIFMNNRTTLIPLLSSNLYLSRNVYGNYLFKWENFQWLYPFVPSSISKSRLQPQIKIPGPGPEKRQHTIEHNLTLLLIIILLEK